MNILILTANDVIGPTHVRLTDRRAEHLRSILKVGIGQRLSLGLLNGNLSTGQVVDIQKDFIDIQLPCPIADFSIAPPATLPATLILGLPRPRMLQRTLQTIATMGVQTLCLIQSARVEKSFWQTPLLQAAAIEEQLILGLEQGKATQLPAVEFYPNWREFAGITLPKLATHHSQKIIAHPGPYPAAQTLPLVNTLIAIGPEGGFIDEEVACFSDWGFEKVTLGDRILRVETAIPVILAKLF